jgi:hypothetical protein
LHVTLGGAKDLNKEKEKEKESTTPTKSTTSPANSSSSSPATASSSPSSALLLQQQQSAASFLAFLQPASSIPLGIPIQIWLSTNYPVDPPQCYIVPSGDPGEMLVANHPIVDRSGMIYAPLLASWNPAESTLVPLLKQFQRIFGVIPPLWIDDRPPPPPPENNNNSFANRHQGSAADENNPNSPSPNTMHNQEGSGVMLANSSPSNNASFGGMLNSENSFGGGGGGSTSSEEKMCVVCLCEEKDTVLVPCGHYCLCSSCSGSVQQCPICRCQIRLRQRVFL